MTTKLTNEFTITDTLSRTGFTNEELTGFFYDWFCKDESLPAKSRKLLGKLKAIAGSKRFDPDATYAFFKNNCPGNGAWYDDFRICDRASGDVIFCVVPSCGHDATRGDAEVWGKKPDGEFGTLVRGTWADVKKFFASTDDEWTAHQATMPQSPFQVGVEVHVKGEYVSYGELPKKRIIKSVNDTGAFCTEDNDYRRYKRDGSFEQKGGRRSGYSRARSYQVELWSAYEAGQKTEDDAKVRREVCDKMYGEIESKLYSLRHGGDQERLDKLTVIKSFVEALIPAKAKAA